MSRTASQLRTQARQLDRVMGCRRLRHQRILFACVTQRHR